MTGARLPAPDGEELFSIFRDNTAFASCDRFAMINWPRSIRGNPVHSSPAWPFHGHDQAIANTTPAAR
jgi:hypothetical protein